MEQVNQPLLVSLPFKLIAQKVIVTLMEMIYQRLILLKTEENLQCVHNTTLSLISLQLKNICSLLQGLKDYQAQRYQVMLI